MACTKTLKTIWLNLKHRPNFHQLFSMSIPPYKRQRITRQSSKRISKSSQRIIYLKDNQNTEIENVDRNDLDRGFRDVRTIQEKSRLLNWVSLYLRLRLTSFRLMHMMPIIDYR